MNKTSLLLRNKQKGLAPILIILLIALAVGGYMFIQKQPKPASISQPSPRPVTTPVASDSAEITTWKTYTNKEYGFSFEYPGDLSFDLRTNLPQSAEFGIYAHNPKNYAEVALIISRDSEDTLVKSSGEDLGKSTINFNGINANKYSGYGGIAGTVYREYVYFTHNGLTYRFSIGTYDRKELLTQILSTFRFDSLP